jgi:hypothetical protein
MWRIYYYPNTGMIKYQINIESASQMEPMPFIDFAEKQDLEGKQVDINSKRLVEAPAIPVRKPSFETPSKVRSFPFPYQL